MLDEIGMAVDTFHYYARAPEMLLIGQIRASDAQEVGA